MRASVIDAGFLKWRPKYRGGLLIAWSPDRSSLGTGLVAADLSLNRSLHFQEAVVVAQINTAAHLTGEY